MKIKISILLLAVGLLSVSCADFLDVNEDPNNPTEVTPDLVLPVGLNYTADYVGSNRRLNHLGNMMMFNFGESQGFNWYRDEFKYSVTTTFYSALFNDAYSRAMKQYEVLTDQSDEYAYYQAIGKIMKAYHFQILVDLFGKVPYENALGRKKNITPEYEDGDVIYEAILDSLTSANNLIESTNPTTAEAVGEDDVVSGGDMLKWEKFANTLKIRILTRLSDKKDACFINGELDKIDMEVGFIEDDVGVNPGYMAEEKNKQNPYWNDLGMDDSGDITLTHRATCATQFVVNYFQETGDPRLGYIFGPSEDNGDFSGINQGAENEDKETQAPEKISILNLSYKDVDAYGGKSEEELAEPQGVLRGPEADLTIMTLAEHYLNMAELANKGLHVDKSAEDYYHEGIKASFAYLMGGDYEEDIAEDYYNQSIENVSWSGSNNKIDAIMTQKWLATMGINAAQSWFDYNRTGYP